MGNMLFFNFCCHVFYGIYFFLIFLLVFILKENDSKKKKLLVLCVIFSKQNLLLYEITPDCQHPGQCKGRQDRLCNIFEIDPNGMLIIATFNMELF